MSSTTISTLDALVTCHTSFHSFDELLNAPGNYRPSLYLLTSPLNEANEFVDVVTHGTILKTTLQANDDLRALADAYDAAQAARGDARRVYRGGTWDEPVAKANDSWSVFQNQGQRDGWVLAVIGTEVLFAYSMPAGRIFLNIEDTGTQVWKGQNKIRSVSLNSLPKKWQAAIREQGGRFTLDDALDCRGYVLREDRRGYVSKFAEENRNRARASCIPQWVHELNAEREATT